MALLIGCQKLAKSFGVRPLFTDLTFGVFDGDRIGLIGPNGAGKSTLLKMLAGLEIPNAGQLSRRGGMRVAYVAQRDEFVAGLTVREAVEERLRSEGLEEHRRSTRATIVLAQTGFTDVDVAVNMLSGGWRKRLALAREVAAEPDLLLLDEPTNHLDLEGIAWLEKFLAKASFTYVMVSHDRYLLERATNRIIELNRQFPEGNISFAVPYADFLVKKQEFLDAQSTRQEALANQVRREVEWLKRGPKARTTKANYRIDKAERLIGDLQESRYRTGQGTAVGIDFTASGRQTKKLVELIGVEKSLGGQRLFQDLSVILSPGTRLGLLGRNGSGKSTLLRLITGQLNPDVGTVRRADELRIATFDQHRDALDQRMTLRQALSPTGDTVLYRGRPIHVSAWAKRFLFRTEQLNQPVSDCSGGEQARILIAHLMLRPADILLLDEPTNDLDIATLEVLEESLTEFPGAIVLVTHDRAMLDRICTTLIGLDGRGNSAEFAAVEQWIAWMEAGETKKQEPPAAARAQAKNTSSLSTKEKRELERMEATIAKAEQAVAEQRKEIERPAVSSDPEALHAACERLHAAELAVEKAYARWQELESRTIS
jgi:ABC transport system ATP-binding/permease protein